MDLKQFKIDLNNLPVEIRHKVYYNLIDRMDDLEHKNKFKLSLNLINKKRHNIYKNLNFYQSMLNNYNEISFENYNNPQNDILTSYMFVNYSDFYLNLREVETEMFKINQNGFYKKFNPSIYDETYYKLKHRRRKNKNHYNRNRNKYSIKDMRR